MTIAITPAARPVDATIELPGSKSYTNRALLIAAIADEPSRIIRALFSDHTHNMRQSMTRLGVAVVADATTTSFPVDGASVRSPAKRAELFIDNAGTAARFRSAAVALGR